MDDGRRIKQSAHVDCDSEHLLELFAQKPVYSKPDPSWDDGKDIEYPGRDWLIDFAESYCAIVFDSDALTSTGGLRYRVLVPTDAAWQDRRDVYCVLYDRDFDQLTRSYVAVE
jgi:hypothetical protein